MPLFGVVQALAYTPDGKELITGGRSLPLFAGALQRWDCRAMAASGEPLISQAAMEGNDLAVSPDGTLIAVGQADKRVLLYDRKLRNPRLLIAHQFPVEQVAFSPDGKLLATRSSDFDGSNSELLVWDVQARRLKFNLEAPHQVLSMTFSPTGQLAHALRDGTVRLWQSGKAGPIIWGPQRRVPRMPLVEQVVLLRYSLDGRLLAIGTETRKLFILEAATGKVRHAVKAHAVEISALAFSPEGQTLATGATDRTIRLWDPALGVERLILDAGDPVRALAFSPDGRQLAAGLEPDILTTEQDPAKLAERLFPIKVWQAPRTRR